MKTSLRLPSFLIALAALSTAAFAQAPTGEIAGTVFDESGAVVPNAPVVVVDKSTGLQRTFTSGATGVFSGPSMPAAVYVVSVEMPGFRKLQRDATVQTGSVTTVDMHLQLGATKEVVTVDAATPQVEFDRHTIDGVVTRQQIQELPMNGRSFLQLAFLEPGVTVSAGAQGQYNRAFDVSILGGDSGLTRITIDGASVRDPVNGGTQQNFSQEVVQEFQVSSVNFDLSTGLAAGGAINVVTRSGSNAFHGAGFFYFRDHNMSAYPALHRDPTSPDPFFARRQTGFWFGGPIKKDRLFFFANYEHNNQRGVFSSYTPDFPNLSAITTSPFNGNQVSARVDYHTEKHNAFLRYSHDGNNSFAPRYVGAMPSAWVNNANWADSGVFSLISTFSPSLVNEFRYSNTFWSNHNTLPTLAQCANCPGLNGPHVAVDGTTLNFGNETNTPQSRLLRRNVIDDNMTLQKGGHHMKFGGEWEHEHGTGTYSVGAPATITLFSPQEVQQFAPRFVPLLPTSYNTINDVLKLPLAHFSISWGDTRQPPPFQIDNANHDDIMHLYWQDSWKMTRRFTLNYGLGWTYETNALNHDIPKPQWLAPIFGTNGLRPEDRAPLHFSPMFGFAWSPFKSDSTVIRGGAGIYYDTINIETRLIERNYINPLGSGYITLPGSAIPNPVPGLQGAPLGKTIDFTTPTAFTGAILMAILPAATAQAMQLVPVNPNNKDLSLTTIDLFKTGTELFPPSFVPPSAQHFSLGMQRQVTKDLAITADFVYRHFIHLVLCQGGDCTANYRDMDLNHFYQFVNGVQTPVIPVCPADLALTPKAPCSNGPVGVITGAGTSAYKALLFRMDKRFSHRYQLQVSYALQAQDGINNVYNLRNYFQYYGPQGPRNVLTVSGMVSLPWKTQMSFISSYIGGSPMQPYIPGIDLTGSGINGFPLPGVTDNLGNRGLSKSDLAALVSQYNQTYAGKSGPNPAQTFPTVTLPKNYDFGHNFNSQDLRVTKMFRWKERYELQLFGEGFNIFNISNLGGYSGNLLAPSFGQPTSRAGNIFGTGGPRAFQFGSRFSF